MNLYSLVLLAQNGNDDALISIISKFNPLINKLSRKLSYEEAETDLVIYFIEIIKNVDLNKFNQECEGKLVSYINVAIKARCIDLFRKYIKNKLTEVELNVAITQESKNDNNMEDYLFIYQVVDMAKLTKTQKDFIIEKFIYERTDLEISKKFNVSRQSVNKTISRALKNIKNSVELY